MINYQIIEPYIQDVMAYSTPTLLQILSFCLPWCSWLDGRKGIQPTKVKWWGAGMAICLEQGADLHTAQLMPLPLIVSCFSKMSLASIKSRLVLHFWYRLTRVVTEKGLLNVCVVGERTFKIEEQLAKLQEMFDCLRSPIHLALSLYTERVR